MWYFKISYRVHSYKVTMKNGRHWIFFYNEIDFSIYISDIMDRLWLMKTYSGLPVLLTFQDTDVENIFIFHHSFGNHTFSSSTNNDGKCWGIIRSGSWSGFITSYKKQANYIYINLKIKRSTLMRQQKQNKEFVFMLCSSKC
jgi:hypothetical protein